jgi:superfamily II DNA helicase RecQ
LSNDFVIPSLIFSEFKSYFVFPRTINTNRFLRFGKTRRNLLKNMQTMKIKHFYIRLNEQYLQEDEVKYNSFMEAISVIKAETQFTSADTGDYWSILVFYRDAAPIEADQKDSTDRLLSFDPSTLNTEERKRYDTLRIWRADIAGKENLPHYIIAHNSQLGLIAKLNPTTTDELLYMKGFGERKVAKYGDEIIAVLNSI